MTTRGELPAHLFVRHPDPQFGARFGGGCGHVDTDGVVCGFPSFAHPLSQFDPEARGCLTCRHLTSQGAFVLCEVGVSLAGGRPECKHGEDQRDAFNECRACAAVPEVPPGLISGCVEWEGWVREVRTLVEYADLSPAVEGVVIDQEGKPVPADSGSGFPVTDRRRVR